MCVCVTLSRFNIFCTLFIIKFSFCIKISIREYPIKGYEQGEELCFDLVTFIFNKSKGNQTRDEILADSAYLPKDVILFKIPLMWVLIFNMKVPTDQSEMEPS